MERSIVKFRHVTSLGDIPRLTLEERRELDKLFPTYLELVQFIESNRQLAQVGVRRVLAMQTAYPVAASAYKSAVKGTEK